MLRGIRRTIGTARAGKAPATADVLMQMVALCPGQHDRQAGPGTAGARVRRRVPAERTLHAAGRDLVDPTAADSDPALKTDQTGGQEVAIPEATLRPVEAVRPARRRRSAPGRCSAP